MNSKFYKEYLSQVNRLNGIARVVAPPKLSMIVVDENKDQELPEVETLTQWVMTLLILKTTWKKQENRCKIYYEK